MKTIHRRLQFTPNDVKEALMFWMRERDHPMPDSPVTSEFKLTNEGAELAWSDSVEIAVER